VLVADDQRLNRMYVSITLGNYGIEAVQASNGEELMAFYQASLNEAGESSFDVVITDINMPGRNGDDVSRAIREEERGRGVVFGAGIPIIAMSGDGAVEDKLHFFEYGMTDYFVKGTNPDVLVRLMVVYLN
jgi:CheY-like chemotaxis protein